MTPTAAGKTRSLGGIASVSMPHTASCKLRGDRASGQHLRASCVCSTGSSLRPQLEFVAALMRIGEKLSQLSTRELRCMSEGFTSTLSIVINLAFCICWPRSTVYIAHTVIVFAGFTGCRWCEQLQPAWYVQPLIIWHRFIAWYLCTMQQICAI